MTMYAIVSKKCSKIKASAHFKVKNQAPTRSAGFGGKIEILGVKMGVKL